MEPIIFTPSRSWIENLQVGDMALDCFGKQAPVTSITFRGIDLKGKAYVGFYTRLDMNTNTTVSSSVKEGETVSTLPIVNKYHTTWNIPKDLVIESDVLPE